MSNSSLDTSQSYIYEAPNETGSPERLLILAMLERAILDYVGNDKKEALEAEEWLFGEIDDIDPEPYTFTWVCRELELSPRSVAQMIREMPKRGSNRVAPWYFSKSNKGTPSSRPSEKNVVGSRNSSVSSFRMH